MTLNPSMKNLVLKYNNFHSVDASFQFYQELEYVDLSSNNLVSIPDRSFINQIKLIELQISGNKISKLSERTFEGLFALEMLILDLTSLIHVSHLIQCTRITGFSGIFG